jgi:hypothetical protein
MQVRNMQTKKIYMGMNKYHLLDFWKILKFLKKGNTGNRKTNFSFWNFKD